MTDKKNDAQVKDWLAASGISQADITLAHETSAVLLDLLASYPLDDRLKKSVRDLFEEAAESQLCSAG